MTADRDEFWMRKALFVARRAGSLGEIPVGAIAVRGGKGVVKIGRAHV